MQYKFFPLSRFCCDPPSRHGASDPLARQPHQDLCSSHNLLCTAKREASDTTGRKVNILLEFTVEKILVLIKVAGIFSIEKGGGGRITWVWLLLAWDIRSLTATGFNKILFVWAWIFCCLFVLVLLLGVYNFRDNTNIFDIFFVKLGARTFFSQWKKSRVNSYVNCSRRTLYSTRQQSQQLLGQQLDVPAMELFLRGHVKYLKGLALSSGLTLGLLSPKYEAITACLQLKYSNDKITFIR